MDEVQREEIKRYLKPRLKEQDKRSFGKLGIIAGSPGMAGAAILCGRAAMRSGAGMGVYFAEESTIPILQTAVPECTCVDRDLLDAQKVSEKGCTACAMGPGLGAPPAKEGFLAYLKSESMTDYNDFEDLFKDLSVPLVLDADGLNALRPMGFLDDFASMNVPKIITPHEGEACRLMNINRIENREEAVKKLAERLRCVAVLKGHHTLIADRDGNVRVNPTGNPGMGTAGSGDVLTGIIGSFLAQGYGAMEAALCGVYLHGLAGDLAAEEYGEFGLTASDIVAYIPKAIMNVMV